MNSPHGGLMSADDPSGFQFPSVLEYLGTQTYAERRVAANGRCFSKDKIFVNDGDTFNAKYIIQHFKNGRYVCQNLTDVQTNDVTTAEDEDVEEETENVEGFVAATESLSGDVLDRMDTLQSGLGLLTRKQYETFLDRPSGAAKIGYLRDVMTQHTSSNGAGERRPTAVAAPDRLAGLRRLRPATSKATETRDVNRFDGDGKTTILTTLRSAAGSAQWSEIPTCDGGDRRLDHLKGCKIVAKDDATAWKSALMQCAVLVFDVTGGTTDDELRDARTAFCYVHDELMKCGDEELTRWREHGTVRHFVLISTAMTWAEEARNSSGGREEESADDGGEAQRGEEAADGGGVTRKNALNRMPAEGRYRTVFELEKSVLRANSTRTKHVFHGHVIGAGVTYGHEQRALRSVFERAWLGRDNDYHAALGRCTVPAVHVDELAELVRVMCAGGRTTASSSSPTSRHYALAIERPSYEFADIVTAVRNEFCHPGQARDRRTPRDIFKNHNLARGDSVAPDGNDDDDNGLGDGFTLDLMRSDLDADHPTLQDFIGSVPEYRTRRAPLVQDVRRLAREYVDARGLRPFRLLVSGRPGRVTARVAEHLARRYSVPLVNVSRAIDDRVDRLRDDLDRLWTAQNDECNRLQQAGRLETEDEYAGDESVEDEPTRPPDDDDDGREQSQWHDASPKVCVESRTTDFRDDNYDTCLSSENANDELLKQQYDATSTKEDVFMEIDRKIRDVKCALTDLNGERKRLASAAELGRPDDPGHLLPLIGKFLASCPCRNRGYVIDVFPLSVDRMHVIFSDEIDYPNAIIIISYDEDDDESSQYQWSRRDLPECDSESSETDSDDADLLKKPTADIKASEKNGGVTETKRVVDYFADKRSKVLRLKAPFGLIDDETGSNDSQYTRFTDSIVAQVGCPLFVDDFSETVTANARPLTVHENDTDKTKKTRAEEKSKSVFKKLSAMKQQWNSDIFTAVARDRLMEYHKSAKIQNYVNKNILSKLLKEISPIGDGDDHSVSLFLEKTLNKSKLCRTLPDNEN